jgi:hypothetical protein
MIWVYKLLDRSERWLVSAFIFVAIALMLVCTLVLGIFTAVQVATSVGASTVLSGYVAWILAFVDVDVSTLKPEQYVALLGSFTGSVAVLVTLWFAVVTMVKYWQSVQQSKARSLIKKEAVYRDGIDDIETMLRFYKKATKVTVFAGDFSWIAKNDELAKEVERLVSERKISFVSYKDEENVKKAISDSTLYERYRSCFHHDRRLKGLKCSLVQVGLTSVLLYKVDNSALGGERNVCVIIGKDDAESLLDALTSLCAQYEPA